jgi:hypothetical protein
VRPRSARLGDARICTHAARGAGLKVNTLLPDNLEARLIINWTERGVLDALERKYVSERATLRTCVEHSRARCAAG